MAEPTKKSPGMARGEAIAVAIIPALKLNAESLSEHEKVLFWAGVFGSLSGACAASIGPGALEAIKEVVARGTSDLLNKKRH